MANQENKVHLDSAKMKTVQKRKAGSMEEHDSLQKQAKKKSFEKDFTDIEFKVMFRDVNTTFVALEKFIEQAMKFPNESSYDIVGSYCRSSGECNEILQLLESGKRKPTEACVIFQFLESVLLRVADDLTKYKAIGQNIVRRIFTAHMGLIFATLAMKNKSSHIKAALKLLVAMVMQGEASVKEFQAQFDFSHKGFAPLLERRDTKDEKDVRTCVLQFMMSFLITGNNNIIRHVVDCKGFLNSIFSGLAADKYSTLELVLPTLLEKVVENPTVNKTSKIRLFNDKTLKDLSKLYVWKGPLRWNSVTKRLEGRSEEVTGISEDIDDHLNASKESVRQMVYALMVQVCCDKKTGINFHDKNLSTSGKNMNHILTNLLTALEKPHTDPLVGELVIKVLQACPDQLHWYLPHLKHSFTPRVSQNWHKWMAFLSMVFEEQEVLSPVALLEDHQPAKIVSMIIVTVIPPREIWNQVISALKHESIVVRHCALEFVKLVITRLNMIQAKCDLGQNREDILEVRQLLKDVSAKLLPALQVVFQCWPLALGKNTKLDSSNRNVEHSEMDIEDTIGIPVTELEQHLSVVLAVLCGYQSFLPELYKDSSLDFSSLLEGVKEVCSLGNSENLPLLQAYLLKLLAGSDVKQISWTKQSAGGFTTMYLLLEMSIVNGVDANLTNTTRHLLQKLLSSTGLFQYTSDEISVWLQHISAFPTDSHITILKFVEKIMLALLHDPYSCSEVISELVSEAGTSNMEGAMDKISIGTSDALMDRVISMEEVDLEADTTILKSQPDDNCLYQDKYPFSPLLPVALECASAAENSVVLKYLDSVLCDILLTQINPLPLCILLSNKAETLSIPTTKETAVLWLPKETSRIKTPKKKTQVSLSSESIYTKLHQAYLVDSDSVKELEKQFDQQKEWPLAEGNSKLTRQILLYIWSEICISNKNVKKSLKMVERLLELLGSILLNECSSFANKGDGSSATGAKHPDFDILNSENSASDSQEILILFKLIFQHPVIKELFLMETTHARKGNFSAVVSKNVATFAKLIPEPFKNKLSSTLSSYVMKVENQMSQEVTSGGVAMDTSVLLTIIEGFADVLSTESLLQVCEQMLKLGQESLVDAGESSSLTHFGTILSHALKTLCLEANTHIFRKQKLSHQGMSNLFTLSVASDAFFDEVHTILKMSAAYSLCIDQETFEQYLTKVIKDKILSEVVSILLSNSSACCVWIKPWLMDGKLWKKKTIKSEHFIRLLRLFLEATEACMDITVWKNVFDNCWSDLLLDANVISAPGGKDKTLVLELLFRKICKSKKQLTVWNNITSSDDHIRTVNMLAIVEKIYRHLNPEDCDEERRDSFLVKCTESFIDCVANKERDTNLETLLMTTISDLTKDNLVIGSKFQDLWTQLVKCCLKYCYTVPAVMDVLCELIPKIYQKSEDENKSSKSPLVSVTSVFQMVVSHSQFIPAMLDEGREEEKDSLTKMLLSLVCLDKACCQTAHLPLLLGAYTASLSNTDQRLLILLHHYETSGCRMSDIKPVIFGPKAVEFHSVRKNLGPSLLRQATTDQVMNLLDSNLLYKSSLKFPVRRELIFESAIFEANSLKSEAECYDPCFLLPLFGQLLRSENVVNCRNFVEHGCLGFVLAALSTHDRSLRGLAAHVLSAFMAQLEGARFVEKEQVMYLLDLVKNSMEKPRTKLACLITVFLVKSLQVILKPEHNMYNVVCSYLLLKPSMDIMNVPEFYKLFNSSALEFKQERAWILDLLRDGLRETQDYHMCQKRYIFKMLLSFYSSALSDNYTQHQVLNVLVKACTLKSVAFDLTKNYSILSWINAALCKSGTEATKLHLLMTILHNLWQAMLSQRDERSVQDVNRPCLPPQFTNEFFLTLCNLLHKSGYMSQNVMATLMACLVSVLRHMDKTNKLMTGLSSKPITAQLHTEDILLFLRNYTALSKEAGLHKEICQLLVSAKIQAVGNNLTSKNGSVEIEPPAEDTTTRETCIKNILEAVCHWAASPGENNEEHKKIFSEAVFLVLKWAINCVKVSVKNDMDVLSKLLLWTNGTVSKNVCIKMAILSDSSGAVSCVLDLLGLYDLIAMKAIECDTDSGPIKPSYVSVKETLNAIFLHLMDFAIAEGENNDKNHSLINNSVITTLKSKNYHQAFRCLAVHSVEEKGRVRSDSASLLIRETWLQAHTPQHFLVSVKNVKG